MAAFEVKSDAPQAGFELRKIPAGRYAKFIVKGNMHSAVRDFGRSSGVWSLIVLLSAILKNIRTPTPKMQRYIFILV